MESAGPVGVGDIVVAEVVATDGVDLIARATSDAAARPNGVHA